MAPQTKVRFQLLNTRRFWIGLWGFLLLVGFYVSTGFTECYLFRIDHFTGSPPLRLPMERGHQVSTCGGRIIYRYGENPSIGLPEWDIGSGLGYNGYDFTYDRKVYEEYQDYSDTHFIPLWPIPLLWLAGWSTYLIRAHRRQSRLFASR